MAESTRHPADDPENIQPAKNEHGQGFPDRPAGEKSRYDPEEEIPDPELVKEDIQEVEKVYKKDENEA